MRKYLNFILAGVCISIFILMMVLIKNGSIVNFDNKIYSMVTFHTSDFLDNMFKCITFLASTKFIVGIGTLIFLFLLFIKKERKMPFIIMGSLGFAAVFNRIVKNVFGRERPTVRRLVVEKTYSFPSGHTNASTALCGILIVFIIKSKIRKSIKIPLCIVLGIIPLLVATSRIYLGAHFASDIVGAFSHTLAWLFIEVYFINKFYDKIKSK